MFFEFTMEDGRINSWLHKFIKIGESCISIFELYLPVALLDHLYDFAVSLL